MRKMNLENILLNVCCWCWCKELLIRKNRVSAKLFIDWFWSKIMSFVFVSRIVEVLKLKIETTFLLESQQMQGWAKSYIAMTCKSANCKFSNYSIIRWINTKMVLILQFCTWTRYKCFEHIMHPCFIPALSIARNLVSILIAEFHAFSVAW